MIYPNTEKALARLWDDRCDVETYADTVKPNGAHAVQREIRHADIPCRISYEDAPAAAGTEPGARVGQRIRLFLAREYEIPAGSRITVRRPEAGNAAQIYNLAGEPKKYPGHQEIDLTIWRPWPDAKEGHT